MSLLDELRDAIVKLANPRRILLFSQKNRPDGTPSSVKLCVVVPGGDPRAVEQRQHTAIEPALSSDALAYTAAPGEQLVHTPYSLAARAQESGRVLYEAE